jgi:hypothetical protein
MTVPEMLPGFGSGAGFYCALHPSADVKRSARAKRIFMRKDEKYQFKKYVR